MKKYSLVISQMVKCITAVYVESLIRNITDAMAKSGRNIDKNEIDRLWIIYF